MSDESIRDATSDEPSPHRVVIIGCGFGGLFAARALKRAPVDVTVVDRTNHHLFQPLLYQLATGILSEGDIAPPIRDVLRKQRNTRVLFGEVTDIDVANHELTMRAGDDISHLPYDSLIVATGAKQSYFGNDQFAENAPGIKSIDDALELRGRIFGAFELAELEQDPDRRRALMTFVVIGAGATGIEMAGQIAELSHRALRRNYRSIDPNDARVVLLDADDQVLSAFPQSLQQNAIKGLRKLGVEVHLNTRVTGVDEKGIDTDSDDPQLRRINASTKVWAAGVEASSLGRELANNAGAALDRTGRVLVNPDCTLEGHPEIFVVGDLMNLHELPGVAEVAMQSGRYAARTIVRRLKGKPTKKPFRYHDLGTLATISRFRAVGTIGKLRFTGFIAWCLWLFVHLVFLTGFKNRFAVLVNWTVAFIGRSRPQRAVTTQQVSTLIEKFNEGESARGR